jgi:hypothetical protein
MNFNRLDDRCHDNCKETQQHSTCILAAPLRRPLLDQMIHKVETLQNKKQNRKRFAQYLKVEQIMKAA